MVDTLTSQFDVSYVYADVTPSIQVSQYSVDYVWNIPSLGMETSSFDIELVTDKDIEKFDVSQFDLEYVWKGRVEDPKVKCFTFTLDGHDYYVIRLGMTETLVFDTQTEQFYIWGSDQGLLWRAYDGCNWLAGYRQASSYGSNIVVGDDGTGTIYFLDPDQDTDDDALEGPDLPRTFIRRATGQVVTKGYSSQRCYGVELLGSIGQFGYGIPATVNLSYSDDRGETYVDAGTKVFTPMDTDARAFWRSLGSIRAPGRIFRVIDYGALKRIDSLSMIAEGEGRT